MYKDVSMLEAVAVSMVQQHYERIGYPLEHLIFRIHESGSDPCGNKKFVEIEVTSNWTKKARPNWRCEIIADTSDEGPVLNKKRVHQLNERGEITKTIEFVSPLSSFTLVPLNTGEW